MKKINIFNFAMLIPLLVADVFYIIYGTLLVKSVASLLFVTIGLVNLIYTLKTKGKNAAVYLLFIGLCFACFGDIFLELYFIVGAIFFGVGHVFYFMSYCAIIKFNFKDLIYGVVIFVPVLITILFVPIFDFGGILMQIVSCVYALIISLMVGKAIANFIKEKSILNLIILIGSALFFFSDFMLLFNVFTDLSIVFGLLCLFTYYPAEFLLAYSILKIRRNKFEA